jgi:prophage regulatory protein
MTKPLDRLVRMNEVLYLTGLSRTTIWKMEREGKFPPKVVITGRHVGWRESAVQEWLDSREQVCARLESNQQPAH